MSAYFALLIRRPHFLRLWLADLVSMLGDWFSVVAVSVLSFSSSEGGLTMLAASLAAHLVPQALAAPFGGHIADRFDRKRVLLAAATIEGALTIGMALAVTSKSAESILVMQGLLAARSIVSSVREPATFASVPRVVDKAEIKDANALIAVTWSACFAIGMALGGLVTSVGPAIALGVDAVSFFGATLLIAGLPAIAPIRSAAPPGEARGRSSRFDGARHVFAVAWGHHLRGPIFGSFPIAFASGAGWIALNVTGHALPIAAGAATTIGILQAVRGAATALGPTAMRLFPDRASNNDFWLVSGAATVLLGTVAMTWAPSLIVAIAAAVSWGAGAGVLWIVMSSEIQTRAEDAIRGRLSALNAAGFTLSMTSGAALTAALVDGGAQIFTVGCALALVASMASMLLFRKPEGATAAVRAL